MQKLPLVQKKLCAKVTFRAYLTSTLGEQREKLKPE